VSPRADVYVSGDVEADGPIPRPYSMLSFGLCVAGAFDGARFERADPDDAAFYRELRPISEEFVPEALATSGLDRDRLATEGAAAADAMRDAHDWVLEAAAGRRPVLVGYPLVFDWLFLYWYFFRFDGRGSPFGHSGGLDMKTMYQQKARALMTRVTKRSMPRTLLSARPHTHNALDDAQEQAELFANLFEWEGPVDAAAR